MLESPLSGNGLTKIKVKIEQSYKNRSLGKGSPFTVSLSVTPEHLSFI